MTEIKVGDTVRITQEYQDLAYGENSVGAEFKVGGIVHCDDSFYVTGDPQGRGVWAHYIEKVESDRWRYNDHIVVYPETRDANGPGRGVTVLNETPLPKIYTRWENQFYADQTRFDEEITEAARAYWEAHETNPVIKEARVRGDYVRFAYQLRYNDSYAWLEKYTKADIDAALPVIDRLALKASA